MKTSPVAAEMKRRYPVSVESVIRRKRLTYAKVPSKRLERWLIYKTTCQFCDHYCKLPRSHFHRDLRIDAINRITTNRCVFEGCPFLKRSQVRSSAIHCAMRKSCSLREESELVRVRFGWRELCFACYECQITVFILEYLFIDQVVFGQGNK